MTSPQLELQQRHHFRSAFLGPSLARRPLRDVDDRVVVVVAVVAQSVDSVVGDGGNDDCF